MRLSKQKDILVTALVFAIALILAVETSVWSFMIIPGVMFVYQFPTQEAGYTGVVVLNVPIIILNETLTFVELITEMLVVSVVVIIVNQMFIKKELDLMTDPLTKAKNRRFYNNFMKKQKNLNGLSMLLIDIDHFKSVNDNYGHDYGDYVLEELTKIIKKSIRKTDEVVRMGGEEFAILSPKTTAKQGIVFSERLRDLVEKSTFSFNGVEINVTISIGFINNKAEEVQPTSLFKLVDNALYRAKNSGRNRVEIA